MEKLNTMSKQIPKERTHISNILHEVSDKAKYDAEVANYIIDR